MNRSFLKKPRGCRGYLIRYSYDALTTIAIHQSLDGTFLGWTDIDMGLYPVSNWAAVPSAVDADLFLNGYDLETAITGAPGQGLHLDLAASATVGAS